MTAIPERRQAAARKVKAKQRRTTTTGLVWVLGLYVVLVTGQTRAQEALKIGILTDMSGGYSDLSGQGSIEMIKLALEDAGPEVFGKPIQIVTADLQGNPDIGIGIARQWFDQGVDAIFDVPNSSVAFGVSDIARAHNKIFFATGAGSSELTGTHCSPNTIHWSYNTYSMAKSLGTALVRQKGESWYFITADYAFGQALERDTTTVITAAGAKVVGSARHPLNTQDFSSYLLQAQSSGADVIGLADAGADLRNVINQAREFGIPRKGGRLAGLIVFILDINSLGLEKAQGLQLASNFYWDMDDQTRALSRRYFARMNRMPTLNQAGGYSAALNYIKAVRTLGSKDAAQVMAYLKGLEIDDAVVHHGKIREDGLLQRDYYIFTVKTPAESKGPWDYYKLDATVPAEIAARPLAEGGCPLVKARP